MKQVSTSCSMFLCPAKLAECVENFRLQWQFKPFAAVDFAATLLKQPCFIVTDEICIFEAAMRMFRVSAVYIFSSTNIWKSFEEVVKSMPFSRMHFRTFIPLQPAFCRTYEFNEVLYTCLVFSSFQTRFQVVLPNKRYKISIHSIWYELKSSVWPATACAYYSTGEDETLSF